MDQPPWQNSHSQSPPQWTNGHSNEIEHRLTQQEMHARDLRTKAEKLDMRMTRIERLIGVLLIAASTVMHDKVRPIAALFVELMK